MFKKLYVFILDTRGVTGVEYGFILGGVGISVMTGAFMAGEEISAVFESLSSYMSGGVTTTAH
ncbi:MAG: hypothetical protein CO093_08485 [Alphaproteobacteria bacterium CG_4_9_14_3_um_filter_47_13]|nr:MAG: hypothetical protein CO093_08485 [Alphaproteobacteria bacterium CG_4_9_14_3_um_filter_47_13]